MIETLPRPAAPTSRSAAFLLPAGARRPLAALATAALGVVALLAVAVAGTSAGVGPDATLERFVAAQRFLRSSLFSLAVVAGEPATAVVVALVVLVVALRRRDHGLALLAVAGPGLTGLLAEVVKPLVGRTIADGSFAFPSGHTAGATSLGLLVVVAMAGAAGHRQARALAAGIVATAAGAVTVAVGLVAEHAHYPTDTLAGFCLALAVTVGCALAIDLSGAARRVDGWGRARLAAVGVPTPGR